MEKFRIHFSDISLELDTKPSRRDRGMIKLLKCIGDRIHKAMSVVQIQCQTDHVLLTQEFCNSLHKTRDCKEP
jgi:hypothetical protein